MRVCGVRVCGVRCEGEELSLVAGSEDYFYSESTWSDQHHRELSTHLER